MVRKAEFAFSVLFLLTLFVKADEKFGWHSTSLEFKEMIKKDLNMVKGLENSLAKERKALSDIRAKLLKEHEQVVSSSLDNDVILDKQLSGDVSKYSNETMFMNLEERLKNFPNFTDRYAVMKNIFKVQRIYKLKTEELAGGKIFGYSVKHNLTANDCADIGDIATNNKIRDICLEWYNETLRLILEGAPCKHSENVVRGGIKNENEFVQCDALCRDGKPNLPLYKNQQKCYLWTNFGNPWLILQPYKMEILSDDPDIARFYDAITDHEIEVLKNLSIAHFASAKTVVDKKLVTNIDSSRIAHNCWLGDGHHIIKRLTVRIGHLTGLDMSQAEHLQVATYGIAGHYVPHYDWHTTKNEKEELSYLNRKGTFMLYLSNVEQGGSTIFMHPGIAVPPVKGSAVFWHNLDKTGFVEKRARHCACPVLVGNKWVANKWIKEPIDDVCKKTDYIGRLV